VLVVLIVVSIVAKTAFALGMGLFIVAFYQQTMLVTEWREDHGPADWVKRGLFSTQVIFYPNLSKRCRRHRHRLCLATVAAFVLVTVGVLLQRLVE
jgi:hypothetical protein